MGRSSFDPEFSALPAEIPIFPLPGALLLPGGRLPLNIFEPRYLAMTRRALAGPRLIGMIQPSGDEAVETGSRSVYPVGCVGRLVAFSETEDGRFLITLAGLIRFRLAEELPLDDEGFRRVRPDYVPFRDDLLPDEGSIDRATLLSSLKSYFLRHGLQADWEAVEKADDERLVTSLAMLCPFAPSEKQVLLEADDLTRRAEAMITILRFAAHEQGTENEGSIKPN